MFNLGSKKVTIKNDFKRVTITQARKLYNNGHTLYIVPSKVYPSYNNMWIQPYKANKNNDGDFEKLVNSYEYYNCNSELGRVANFYI